MLIHVFNQANYSMDVVFRQHLISGDSDWKFVRCCFGGKDGNRGDLLLNDASCFGLY